MDEMGYLTAVVILETAVLIYYAYRTLRKMRTEEAGIQIIECCEKINQKIFDKSSLGPAAGIQIKAEEAGPGSKQIDVDHMYIAVYRFRNLSNTTVERISVRLENQPKSMWFDIKQGEIRTSDWDNLKKEILQESQVSNEAGWQNITIPYLNPYSTTKHEALLEIASYLPLDSMKILGGWKGIGFNFSKPCDKRSDPWYESPNRVAAMLIPIVVLLAISYLYFGERLVVPIGLSIITVLIIAISSILFAGGKWRDKY